MESMKNIAWLDRLFESSSRYVASKTARRSFLSKLGTVMVGSALAPLLPVARFAQAQSNAESEQEPAWNDPKQCDYWAYCSIQGWLCACCGGTSNKCPPGTEKSPIAWVGTCRNPADNKSYVMSYHDCCGASSCGSCNCEREEGATERYQLQRTPYVTWCFGGVSGTYMCTISEQLSVVE